MLSLFRHPGYKKDSNACPAPQFIRPECAVARPGKILIDGATRLIPKCPLLVNCLFVSRQNESHPVHYLRALYVPMYVLRHNLKKYSCVSYVVAIGTVLPSTYYWYLLAS